MESGDERSFAMRDGYFEKRRVFPLMRVVPMAGLEPARVSPADFKSAVSAYYTTSAD